MGVGYKLIGFGQTLWIRLNPISIITLNIWILNWWIQSPVPNLASCEENWKITNFRNIYNNELLNYNISGCQMKPRSIETNRLSRSFSTLKSPIQEKAKFGNVWLTPNFFSYCHTRLHLGFKAKLKIWQASACKMEPQSGIIIVRNRPPQCQSRRKGPISLSGCLVDD